MTKDIQNKFSTETLKDVEQEYLSKKAEKIAQAIYILTHAFDVREALRWSLRDASLGLLSRLANVSFSQLNDKTFLVQEVQRLCKELESLLLIGQYSRLITSMNVSYIVREVRLLNDFIIEKYERPTASSVATNSLTLSEDFFAVPNPNKVSPQDTKDIYSRTQIKDRSPLNTTTLGLRLESNNVEDFRRALEGVVAKPDGKGSDRRGKIIEIARRLPGFSIKDIAKEVPGVSEKTIQRELLQMVQEGVLKKEGERRWSRYTLLP